MNANFSVKPHEVHLWRAFLPDLVSREDEYFQLLSPDEVTRAKRFLFPEHKQRFVLSRGILRHVLNLYTGTAAYDIHFEYGPRGKPFLKQNPTSLQFNVSHSHDMVVIALATSADVGIDIEMFESKYNDAVAKRFFHPREYDELNQLPENKRLEGFFRVWAAKEAMIKAIGEGLYVNLDDFFISLLNRFTLSYEMS